uniref:Uncharacterized protein n=1 Tax=Arion vulgaris TaxID=1028688 RepID=A0A0B6Y950_9EUPU
MTRPNQTGSSQTRMLCLMTVMNSKLAKNLRRQSLHDDGHWERFKHCRFDV